MKARCAVCSAASPRSGLVLATDRGKGGSSTAATIPSLILSVVRQLYLSADSQQQCLGSLIFLISFVAFIYLCLFPEELFNVLRNISNVLQKARIYVNQTVKNMKKLELFYYCLDYKID